MKKLIAISLFIFGCTTDGQEDFIQIYEPQPIATPQYTLTVTSGSGGSVSPTSVSFTSGSGITITATPDSGYIFDQWSNGSTENPLTLLLNSNTAISASFIEVPTSTGNYTLTVNSQAGGTVSSSGGTYAEGTEITLTAAPNDGYAFVGWSNGVLNESITIVINSNTTLTANFDIIPPDTIYIGENGITIIASPLAEAGSTASLNGNSYTIVSEDQLRNMVNNISLFSKIIKVSL